MSGTELAEKGMEISVYTDEYFNNHAGDILKQAKSRAAHLKMNDALITMAPSLKGIKVQNFIEINEKPVSKNKDAAPYDPKPFIDEIANRVQELKEGECLALTSLYHGKIFAYRDGALEARVAAGEISLNEISKKAENQKGVDPLSRYIPKNSERELFSAQVKALHRGLKENGGKLPSGWSQPETAPQTERVQNTPEKRETVESFQSVVKKNIEADALENPENVQIKKEIERPKRIRKNFSRAVAAKPPAWFEDVLDREDIKIKEVKPTEANRSGLLIREISQCAAILPKNSFSGECRYIIINAAYLPLFKKALEENELEVNFNPLRSDQWMTEFPLAEKNAHLFCNNIPILNSKKKGGDQFFAVSSEINIQAAHILTKIILQNPDLWKKQANNPAMSEDFGRIIQTEIKTAEIAKQINKSEKPEHTDQKPKFVELNERDIRENPDLVFEAIRHGTSSRVNIRGEIFILTSYRPVALTSCEHVNSMDNLADELPFTIESTYVEIKIPSLPVFYGYRIPKPEHPLQQYSI